MKWRKERTRQSEGSKEAGGKRPKQLLELVVVHVERGELRLESLAGTDLLGELLELGALVGDDTEEDSECQWIET